MTQMKYLLTIDSDSVAGFKSSLASLSELAQRSAEIGESLLGLLDCGTDLVRFERRPAPAAAEVRFALQPGDAFLCHVAAVRACEWDFEIVEHSSHGWPILSIGVPTPVDTGSGAGCEACPVDGARPSDGPPQRMSVHDKDFDWAAGSIIDVLLDGIVQQEVIAYDCDAGTVTRNALDAEGKVQLTPDGHDILKETVAGTVEVRWMRSA